MQEQVKATFLVNAAVLLEFRGTKLLIDGIYDENGHCFSNLSERQWEKLKAGEGEFAGIEYLLFTHEHGDHFSPQRVAEYLEYRQPKAIFYIYSLTTISNTASPRNSRRSLFSWLPFFVSLA